VICLELVVVYNWLVGVLVFFVGVGVSVVSY